MPNAASPNVPPWSGNRVLRRLLPAVACSALLLCAPAVASAGAPTVSVTSPTAGQRVSATVTLGANAWDDVAVTQAKWYIDGTEVWWDGAAPWSGSWDSRKLSDGQHSIFAKAADATGSWGTSPVVTFTVDNAGTSTSGFAVYAGAPVAGATVSGTTTVTATTSNDSRVSQLKWFVDGSEVGMNYTAPWDDTWDTRTVADGTHVMVVKALDKMTGAWVSSSAVSFAVKNSATTPTAGGAAPTGWQLVLSDSFDGSAVDLNKWRIYGPNWPGNLGIGLRDGRAVSVGNGMLTITAQMINGTLVTGAITSRLNQAYGRWEFRARTDVDPSATISAAILTWPTSGNWPAEGENDIYETLANKTRTPFYTFIHYGSSNQQYYYVHNNYDASQWHHMALEWEPDVMRIYRDGTLVYTLTDRNAIPDWLHRLCIQLDPMTWFSIPGPIRLQVDDVKIYARP